MHSDDNRADNLYSRLFSYSPRQGREPLEDFCTEGLAWCLRKSPEFLSEFLALSNVQGMTEQVGLAASTSPEVSTQVRLE